MLSSAHYSYVTNYTQPLDYDTTISIAIMIHKENVDLSNEEKREFMRHRKLSNRCTNYNWIYE